jgi:hypothetical protein
MLLPCGKNTMFRPNVRAPRYSFETDCFWQNQPDKGRRFVLSDNEIHLLVAQSILQGAPNLSPTLAIDLLGKA